MPFRLDSGDGSPIALANVSFAQDVNEFILASADSATEVRISSRLVLPGGVNPTDYQMVVLKNRFLFESNIFQVYETAIAARIGWLFPLQALLSNQHAEAQNEHFLRYAEAAMRSLLLPTEVVLIPQNGLGAALTLADFYPADTALLVLSTQRLQLIPGFDANNYLPDLFRYGFVSGNSASHPAPAGGRTETLLRSLATRINVTSISPPLRTDPFLQSLFKGEMTLDGHPLATFLILYQVFELLIERVFQVERTATITAITTLSNTVADAKTAVRNLQDAISEDGRLRKLTARHMQNQPDCSFLENACSRFLTNLGITPKPEFAGFLYPVRNRVVHEFRSIPASAIGILREINDELLVLVCDLVIFYRE